METYTIATLKEANRQRPILCPDTPNLYFCAVIEMDFDGPDFMGPPILDCVKTYYEGKPALALVSLPLNTGRPRGVCMFSN